MLKEPPRALFLSSVFDSTPTNLVPCISNTTLEEPLDDDCPEKPLELGE